MKWTKGAALQNEGMIVIIEDGARNKYSDKKTGATKKKWCPGSAGGGLGRSNLTGALMLHQRVVIMV